MNENKETKTIKVKYEDWKTLKELSLKQEKSIKEIISELLEERTSKHDGKR